ncbi:MAG: gamma-glutamyl-gamma-aminobutyrate hydrolase family protein [Nitrospira sp.]|nr:gamma-glutamyl-gamma-aminobutyrate hydrolase family protein [Nitrospira sp.]MDH4235996.1 gamma-glutamyl-gamma-aminobutyrate hydrolase family protein [Nitrospira sp.]MDH5626285.1 gamma-glutamyl-gamma-aminobutyrate hydrolase family protein [Nitrospira sp.]
MKPVIGVTPDFNAGDRLDMGGQEPTYFLRARYIRAIEELGGIPLILPLVAAPAARRRLLDGVDGLLLTGSGPDLPPRLYGERQRYKFPLVSERRTDFELDLVSQARTRDLPLLGICGGMQTVNVACGGSLFQDISSQVPTALDHRQQKKAIHVSHPVTVTPNSLLQKVVDRVILMVNSSHHQSVKLVAPSLVASAIASDGIIEAIESPKHRFLLAVQWHPEFLFERHAAHRRLFDALLRAARRTRA